MIPRRELVIRAAAAVLAAAVPLGSARAELRRITIGANPAGTNFNLVAGGFAKALHETLGIPSIVRPYSGSSVYVPMLQRGEITLGVNSSLDSYLAYTGQSPYRAAMPRLRAVMAVYPLGYMFWVKAASGLRRVEDLRGRRVVMSYRGLVVLDRLNRAILASGGLSEDDVEPVTAAGLPEGARIVQEGRADAVAMGYRLPLVRQTHTSLPGGLRFLTMGTDTARVPEIMPGAWVETVEPDATTVGIDAPVRVAMYQSYLNTGLHLADEDAHAIVAALHASWPDLRSAYSVLAPVEPDAIADAVAPHPYHAGAVAYFRAAGLWTEAHERNQQRALA